MLIQCGLIAEGRIDNDKRRYRQNGFWVYAKSPVHSPTATCRRGRLREYTGLLPSTEDHAQADSRYWRTSRYGPILAACKRFLLTSLAVVGSSAIASA